MCHLADTEAAPDRVILLRVSALKLIAFDFDDVFTDNAMIVDENRVGHVLVSSRDGFKPIIISTEVNEVMTVLMLRTPQTAPARCARFATWSAMWESRPNAPVQSHSPKR